MTTTTIHACPLGDTTRLNGARATFALGAMTRRCYLQTLFCRAPGA